MNSKKKFFIANLAPDDMQCVGCDEIKLADDIDWKISDEAGQIVCIDCVDAVDGFLKKERG